MVPPPNENDGASPPTLFAMMTPIAPRRAGAVDLEADGASAPVDQCDLPGRVGGVRVVGGSWR